MKYQIHILSALLALVLAACSSDNDIITPSDESHEVSIVLTPENINGQGTRATVDGDDKYNENLISYVNLYFFTGAGEPATDAKIACMKERIVPATYSPGGNENAYTTTLQFKLSNSELNAIFGTGNSCRVLVLANYNNTITATTYSELKDAKLTSTEFANSDKVSELVMTGEGTLTKGTDNKISATEDIKMYRNAAKINIRFENTESDTWKLDTLEARVINLNDVTTFDRTAPPTIDDSNVQLINTLWHGIPAMKTTDSQGGLKTYDLMPIYSYPIDWYGKEEKGPQVIALARWKKTTTTEGETESTTETKLVSYQFPLVIQTGSNPTQTINKLESNKSYIVDIKLVPPTD